jgi:ATP-dependent helicase/nuclease subunit A
MDDHEKLRLLYVAATRARDHLIVSGHHKATTKVESTYATRISTFCGEHPELVRRLSETAEPDGASEPGDRSEQITTAGAPGVSTGAARPLADRDRWLDERAALLEPFDRPRTLSATAIARSVDATMADADDDSEHIVDDDGPTVVRKKGRAGSAIGSAVHATLEFVDFDAPDGLAALAARQCELHAISDAFDTVLALATSALRSDAVDLARRHPSYRELYVAAPLSDVMIEGYIDLLVETPAGLVIVDYKTDSASSPKEIDAKLAAYELQGAAYAVALEESTGLEVIDCRFVFCKASGAIERSVVDLVGAKQRVRAAVASGLDPTAGPGDSAGGAPRAAGTQASLFDA